MQFIVTYRALKILTKIKLRLVDSIWQLKIVVHTMW
jgi:hypothetical protein